MQGSGRIPGAYVRWSRYRAHMTEYILKDGSRQDRVLILGAGGCDDIDIIELTEHTSYVLLADVNRPAMEEAYRRVRAARPDLMPKLHLLETNLLPIPEAEYQAYDQACRQGINELEQWWEQLFCQGEQVAENGKNSRYNLQSGKSVHMLYDVWGIMQEQGIACFDTVICLGLHSQLYIEAALRIYEQKEELNIALRTRAVELIRKANEDMAEQFMKEVLQIGKRVILGLEYTTIFPDSKVQQEEIRQQLMQKGAKGLHALELPRIEGAYQIEQRIADLYREHKLRIKDCQYLFWPFSEEKSYLMVIYVV